jgi:Dynamin family
VVTANLPASDLPAARVATAIMIAETEEVNALNRDIIAECERLRRSIQTISDKNFGLLEKSEIKSTLLPFVLLLGNHSSGKSSFVNYLMDRKIQTAGVAPTDDNFTIVAPGLKDDVDRDGSSLIGDPDLGFQGLRQFGPTLIHRTQLKIRSGTRIKDFCVVDTPGMIDSPIVKDHFGTGRHSAMDRGYNFEGVCRWYAERADVILLFFDPDKPGTTGETLSILTNSLNGLEHKLYIILNKADQFMKIHDFARAYGSLCWNLSKVIQRKDLPQIYTMCLPLGTTESSSLVNSIPPYTSSGSVSKFDGNNVLEGGVPGQHVESTFLRQVYTDLEESRLDVTKEVFNAPKRRVYHEISRLSDSVHLLLMHCKVIDSTITRYSARVWAHRKCLLAVGCAVAVTGYVLGTLIMDSHDKAVSIPSSSSSAVAAQSVSDVCDGAAVAEQVQTIPVEKGFKFFSFFKSGEKIHAPQGVGVDNIDSTSTAVALTSNIGEINSEAPSILSDGSWTKKFSKIINITGLITAGLSSLFGFNYCQEQSLDQYATSLTTEESFNETFSIIYASSVAEEDEFIKSLWEKVRRKLLRSATYVQLSALPKVIQSDLNFLENVLEVDVANLRRQASPNFPMIALGGVRQVKSQYARMGLSGGSSRDNTGTGSGTASVSARPAALHLTPVPVPFPARTEAPVPAPVRTDTPVPAPVRTDTPVPATIRTDTPVTVHTLALAVDAVTTPAISADSAGTASNDSHVTHTDQSTVAAAASPAPSKASKDTVEQSAKATPLPAVNSTTNSKNVHPAVGSTVPDSLVPLGPSSADVKKKGKGGKIFTADSKGVEVVA